MHLPPRRSGAALPSRGLAPFVLVLGLLAPATAVPSPVAALQPAPAETVAAARDNDPVVVVAVGDIACRAGASKTETTCRQGRTARLTEELDPDAVLALGDLQYDEGALYDFRNAYDRTWGDLRSITYPVPGNHEYNTPEARSYYRYFRNRQPGRPGYYAFDLGRWRVYALNTNCSRIRCRAEYRWLRDDLEDHPRRCSVFAMHHPRWSSGAGHGSDEDMSRFFSIAYRHDVELFLAGHEHNYERFRRMDRSGDPTEDGVMSIVSGAGGRSHYGFGDVERGSAYRNADDFGVLRLALRQKRYSFSFRDVDGGVADRGRRSCH